MKRQVSGAGRAGSATKRAVTGIYEIWLDECGAWLATDDLALWWSWPGLRALDGRMYVGPVRSSETLREAA